MPFSPFEIVVATPFEVYIAPVGEAFPEVDAAPAGNWALLGTNGNRNMTEDGVTVQHSQTIKLHMVYGSTMAVKATRSQEEHRYTFTLLDILPTEYSRILNHNTVTSVAAGAGTPGHDDINLYQGFDVTEKAWLFRGPNASPMSSTGSIFNLQYEVPTGIIDGSPKVVYNKTDPAGLLFEVVALFDDDETAGEEAGRLVVQDAVAS